MPVAVPGPLIGSELGDSAGAPQAAAAGDGGRAPGVPAAEAPAGDAMGRAAAPAPVPAPGDGDSEAPAPGCNLPVALVCNHVFHDGCIQQWLHQSRR